MQVASASGCNEFGDIDDACGVCGGDGLSCAGCDGVAHSGLEYVVLFCCVGHITALLGRSHQISLAARVERGRAEAGAGAVLVLAQAVAHAALVVPAPSEI